MLMLSRLNPLCPFQHGDANKIQSSVSANTNFTPPIQRFSFLLSHLSQSQPSIPTPPTISLNTLCPHSLSFLCLAEFLVETRLLLSLSLSLSLSDSTIIVLRSESQYHSSPNHWSTLLHYGIYIYVPYNIYYYMVPYMIFFISFNSWWFRLTQCPCFILSLFFFFCQWGLSRTQCWCLHGLRDCYTHHFSMYVGFIGMQPGMSVTCSALTAMGMLFAFIAAPQGTRIIKSFRLGCYIYVAIYVASPIWSYLMHILISHLHFSYQTNGFWYMSKQLDNGAGNFCD